MTSDATTVDEYLKEVPEKRVQAISELRNLCLKILSGYSESMDYGMPTYKIGDEVRIAYASQKQHICIYIMIHDVMLNNAKRLNGINHGKCCIRYSNPNKIDYDLIEDLLKETVSSKSKPC